MDMDLQQLRQQPHLSFSAINDYKNCGLKYRFSRIDKVSPDFIPDVLVFGRCIHQVLEEFNYQRLIGEMPTLSTLTGIFETLWDKAVEDKVIHYSKGKDYQILRNSGVGLITQFYQERPPDEYRVLGIEEPFSMQMDGLPYPLIGSIDLIEEDEAGAIIITDYKTSSRAYSKADIDQDMQLTLYQMAMGQNGFSDREILLKLDCLIKTQKPKYQQYYTVRDHQDMQKLVNYIHLVFRGISQGVFMPTTTRWMCPNCAYKSHCDQWLMENSHAAQ